MAYSDFTKQDYSNQDFLRLIEHRIRKEIRQHHLLSTKETYQLEETTSLQSQVLTHFLKQIFHDRLDLSQGKIISTDYLELFITKKLDVFLEAKQTDELFDQEITPLRSITEHEIQEVAKILSLEGEFVPVNQEIIESLQNKYPQTKPSFLKSFTHINQLENISKK